MDETCFWREGCPDEWSHARVRESSGCECSARLDKVSKYVRDLGQLGGEGAIQRNYVRRVQVEQSEARRWRQVWFFSGFFHPRI